MAYEEMNGNYRTAIFLKLVKWEDCCCAWAYLSLLKESGEDWEKRTGVTRRTLVRWRQLHRRGQLSCNKAEGCLLNKLPSPLSRGPGKPSAEADSSPPPAAADDEPQG